MVANHFSSRLGCSLYLSNSSDLTSQWLSDYHNAGFSFAFSTLNMIEEEQDADSFSQLVAACQQAGMTLFVDINRASFQRFGVLGLKELGVTALRIDDGLSLDELSHLAQEFLLVLNASTLTDGVITAMKETGMDLSKIFACHNYYPKPYTGLSRDKVRAINQRLHSFGIKVISFIAGEERRFPLYEGLPTIEDQRNMRPIQAALESLVYCQSDFVCVGDNALSESSLRQLSMVAVGVIPLVAEIPDQLVGMVFENRLDASEYVIRAADSRSQLQDIRFSGPTISRKRGDIVVANEQFLRYQSELEICLVDLPADPRQMVVGRVRSEDLSLLEFIQSPFRFTFVTEKD